MSDAKGQRLRTHAGDYSSNGCIKLAPNDLKDLFTHFNRAGWPKNLTLHVSGATPQAAHHV
ncbi:hypothetical protein [Streptomyces sp. NBC_01594]|uniref:hypothetical protein n=1 Tax=Streptomyces sp. NBC_01594 TaxID=2975890 RepID=UPI0038659EF1